VPLVLVRARRTRGNRRPYTRRYGEVPVSTGATEDSYSFGTTYRVIQHKNLTYGVEVTRPGKMPFTVTKFHSDREAQAWIAEQRRKAKEAQPKT
jgi:hypothetical protein